MKKNDLPTLELTVLGVGEIICAILTNIIYLVVSYFSDSVLYSYKVITGSLLGAVVIFLNFLFLAISTTKVLREAREARGTREMTDEEIDEFVKEHQRRYDVMVKTSFIVRNISMIATLVVAFLLDCFDVIATLVPLVMYRPLLAVAGMIGNKNSKNGVEEKTSEGKEED